MPTSKPDRDSLITRTPSGISKATWRADCEQPTEIRNQLLLLRQSVGARYSNCSLDNYQVYDDNQRVVIGKLRDLTDRLTDHIDNGGGLTLYGPCGGGKDHLLASLLFEAIRQGRRVKWLAGASVAKYKPDPEAYVDDVLAISNPIATEKLPKWEQSSLEQIVDDRYRRLQSTWCTLNVHDSAAAAKLYDASTIDRLREGVCIHCNWPSFRTRGQP